MSETRSGPARILLLLAGLAFAGAALLYNEWLIGAALSNPIDGILPAIRRSEGSFALLAVILLGAATAAPRIAFLRSPAAARIALLVLVLGVPLTVGELALRPFASREAKRGTTLFMRDAELGWRLRPGASAEWGGVRVRVNALGMRGPEVAAAKPPGSYRILYLGDSVTFGFGIAEDLETYPYRAEASLEARTGREIETLNSGVGGWSPWQQALFLEREGLRHAPDLVVVGFVLNDVTEKLGLSRYGGSGEGFQVSQIQTRSARLAEASALLHYGRRAVARLRFGSDLAAGAARQEALDVRTLVEFPERSDVARAWALTLDNLDGIVTTCRESGIELALVVFPFTFQLTDPPRLGAPQRILSAFARERGIPSLDLLPVLSRELERSGRPVEDYFMDEDHLTPLGAEVAGRALGEWLAERVGPASP